MPNPGCFDFWIKHCSSSQLWFCKHFTKAPLQSFLKGIHQSPAVFGVWSSLVMKTLCIGRSHPIYTSVSDWRMLLTWATRLMVLQYSSPQDLPSYIFKHSVCNSCFQYELHSAKNNIIGIHITSLHPPHFILFTPDVNVTPCMC